MAVKYSLDLNQKLKPCTSKVCEACGLYLNQLPVCEEGTNPHVFWVGLSAVQMGEGIERVPLSTNTRSGALIESIGEPLKGEINFYKTNLVKCLPLKEGKIRYPLEHEMEKCFPNFKFELETLRPTIVFLLGRQVSLFVAKKLGFNDVYLSEDFNYESFENNNITFVPVHHPSYILVYKRKYIQNYISSIQNLCESLLCLENMK